MGFAKGPNRETDSMKSTWYRDPERKGWSFFHWTVHILDLYPQESDKPVPKFSKDDKVPYAPQWPAHRWVLTHAFYPILLHYGIRHLLGHEITPGWAFLLYAFAFQFNSIHQIWVMRRLGHTLGYFDGDVHDRDNVPDHAVDKTVISLLLTTYVRPAIAIGVAYSRATSIDITRWLPVELFLYPIVLDMFFYTYHRGCHEIDSLWKYHRTHHLTKHPIPLLSSYADSEQEIIELALIPFLTYVTLKACGFPMSFHDWWVCHCYIIFTEASGHSGLRWHTDPPSINTPVLRYFDATLVLEDHDLHHRYGYRTSCNYGKATRVWDRVFGTTRDRVEGRPDNIDYEHPAIMPLF